MSDAREVPGRETVRYRIVVAGRLDESWSEWFRADSIEPRETQTVLEVRVVDQAELLGRLRRIHDLNLRLLAVALEPPTYEGAPPPDALPSRDQEHGDDIP